MRKLIYTIVLLTFLVAGCGSKAIEIQTYDEPVLMVAVEDAECKEAAGEQFKVVGKVDKYVTYMATGYADGWYEIDIDGMTAYIEEEYLTKESEYFSSDYDYDAVLEETESE